MSRRFGRIVLAVVSVVVLGAGCGVRPSGVITGGPAPTGPAEGALLYFLTDSSLMPVLRPTRQRLSPTRTLALLQAGPDAGERAANLSTEVPAGLGPVSVRPRASGTVEVVVTADVTTLSTRAVDQIVCTAGDALATGAPVTLTGGGQTRGPRVCPLTE